MSVQRVLLCAAAALSVLGAACLNISGMRFSGVLCWAAALGLIVYAVLDRLSAKRAWAKHAKRALLAFFCAGFAFFLALEAAIVFGARGDEGNGPVACVLVLGAGVDGVEPSLTLARRLDAALAYVADKPDVPMIVSGCQGLGEDISEAECMFRYLRARGVAEERIWKEEQASSTRTNFTFSLAMMAEHGIPADAPFVFVTSDFHIARSRYIARRAGIAEERLAAVGSTLPCGAYYTVLTLNFYIREAFALANEMLLGVDLDI